MSTMLRFISLGSMLIAYMIFGLLLVIGGDLLPQVESTKYLNLKNAIVETKDGTESVRLPYYFHSKNSSEGPESRILSLNFQADSIGNSLTGIYIPNLSRSISISVNNVPIIACPAFNTRKDRCIDKPLITEIPTEIIVPGRNLVSLTINPTRVQISGVSDIYIGDLFHLEEVARERNFIIRVATHSISWGAIFLAVIGITVGLGFKKDMLLLFGAASFLNGLFRLISIEAIPWVSSEHLEMAMGVFRLTGTAVMIRAIVILLIGDSGRPLHIILNYFAWILPLFWILQGSDSGVYPWTFLPLVLLGAGFIGHFLFNAVRKRDSERIIIGCYMEIIVISAFVGFLELLGIYNNNLIQMSWYTFSGILGIFGHKIVSTIYQVSRDAIQQKEVISKQLSLREAELKTSYAEIIELEKKSSILLERERVMMDIHDGVGSSLSSAKLALNSNMLPAARVSEIIDDCIEDIQLLLDCRSPQNEEFLDLVIDYRHRLERRLSDAELNIHWHVSIDSGLIFDNRSSLNLMRIIQESITNSIRHSGAENLYVEILHSKKNHLLTISIWDDGSFSPSPNLNIGAHGGGRGRMNMESRAKSLGAHIEFVNSKGQVGVFLSLVREDLHNTRDSVR